jgi:hypothetical protein
MGRNMKTFALATSAVVLACSTTPDGPQVDEEAPAIDSVSVSTLVLEPTGNNSVVIKITARPGSKGAALKNGAIVKGAVELAGLDQNGPTTFGGSFTFANTSVLKLSGGPGQDVPIGLVVTVRDAAGKSAQKEVPLSVGCGKSGEGLCDGVCKALTEPYGGGGCGVCGKFCPTNLASEYVKRVAVSTLCDANAAKTIFACTSPVYAKGPEASCSAFCAHIIGTRGPLRCFDDMCHGFVGTNSKRCADDTSGFSGIGCCCGE